MQEVGFWAYERLLLAGATNAPSSLARPVVFDPTAGPREQRAPPAVPVAEHSGKFQLIGLNRICLPPLRNTAVETKSRHRTSELAGALLNRDNSDHRGYASSLKAGQHTHIHAAYYYTHERDMEEDYAYRSDSIYGITKTKQSFIVLLIISA